MNLEEWLLLLVSLLSLIAGVAILLGLLGAIFNIFFRLWYLFLIPIVIGLLLI